MKEMSDKAAEHLGNLRDALASSYARRSRHIFYIGVALFFAAAVIVVSMLRLIGQSKPSYGVLTMTTGAVQALALVLIILGLILHGMSLGRMTSMMVGVLRSSIDMLMNEISSLSREVMPGTVSVDPERSSKEQGSTSSDPLSFGETSAKSERLRAANAQVRSILSELDSTGMAVQSQITMIDMALFAYGFAAICLLTTGVLAFGSTEHAEYLRILLLAIGTVCAAACYAVLARPTNPQFLVEQSLRKLGLSLEALTDSMRARAGNLPPMLDDHEVFEPIRVPEDVEARTDAQRTVQ
jgi:hypothetical protein